MRNNSWHVRGHFGLLVHAHCDMAEHETIGVVLRKGMDHAIASFKPQCGVRNGGFGLRT